MPIDYSKWDNIDCSSSEEEHEVPPYEYIPAGAADQADTEVF